MAVVRQYPLPEQEARPIPAVYPQTPAAGDLATFGGAQARDLQQAGANLERTADTTFGIFERAAKDANDLKVDSDANSFIAQKQKTIVDFSQLRGEDAIKGAAAATESLLNSKKALMEGATNDYQRNNLSKRLDAHLIDATSSISQHVAKEARAFEVTTNAATGKLMAQDAFLKQDDIKAFDNFLDLAAQHGIKTAKAAGYGPDSPQAKEATAELQSEMVSTAVRSKIAVQSPSTVAFFDRYKDKILAKDRPAIEAAIATMESDRKAHENATRPPEGGAGGTDDNNIGNITVSGAPYAGGKGTPRGKFETFQTPEHGVAAAYQLIDTKAKANGGSISFFDLIAGNGKVQGWAPADDGKDPTLKGNNPAAYAARLAQAVGLKPGDPIPINDDGKMAAVLKAMNLHEKGKQTVRDESFANGILLAKGDQSVVPQPPPTQPPPRPGVPGPVVAPPAGTEPVPTGPPSLNLPPKPPAGTEPAVTPPVVPPPVVPPPAGPDPAQGIPNVREMLIKAENLRQAKIAEYNRKLASGEFTQQDYTKSMAATNALHTQQVQEAALEKNKIWDAIWQSVKARPFEMPNANLTSQIEPKELLDLQNLIEKNRQGKKPVTDDATYIEIRDGLTSTNQEEREKWAAQNPMQWRPRLADKEYDKILELRDAVRKGDPDAKVTHAQTTGQMIKERLGEIEVKTGEKATVVDREKERRFTEAAQDRITALEKSKGKRATPKEVSEILNELTYEIQGTGPGFFGPGTAIVSPRRRAYEMKITDIPKAEVRAVTDALKAEGIEPSDANIVDRYNRANRVKPR